MHSRSGFSRNPHRETGNPHGLPRMRNPTASFRKTVPCRKPASFGKLASFRKTGAAYSPAAAAKHQYHAAGLSRDRPENVRIIRKIRTKLPASFRQHPLPIQSDATQIGGESGKVFFAKPGQNPRRRPQTGSRPGPSGLGRRPALPEGDPPTSPFPAGSGKRARRSACS